MNRWHVDYTKDDYEREWKEARRRTLKRDRYQCRVFSCTVKGAKNLTVHHILPRDLGGGNNDANLITLCPKHHDEIEVACIRHVTLIEAWEGTDEAPNGLEDMTSIILATISDDHTVIGGLGVKNRSKDATKAKRLPRHRCADGTVEALDALLIGSTLAEVTKQLGYSPQFASTLSAILHGRAGAISSKREDELRAKLGLDSIAPVQIKRSDKVPVVEAPLKMSKRKPLMRRVSKPAPERKPRSMQRDYAATYTPPEITPVDWSGVELETDDYDSEYVILGENNEWREAPRQDTTIGVRITDASKFDTLAELTKMSKADMFAEVLGFYLKAHDIEFVECSQEEYEVVKKVYGYMAHKEPSTISSQVVSQIVTEYCLERGVNAIEIDHEYFKSLLGNQDFKDFANAWTAKQGRAL